MKMIDQARINFEKHDGSLKSTTDHVLKIVGKILDLSLYILKKDLKLTGS